MSGWTRVEELMLSLEDVKRLNTKSWSIFETAPPIHVHRFTGNPMKSQLWVRQTSKQIGGSVQTCLITCAEAGQRAPTQSCAGSNAPTHSGQLPRCILLFINPERCLPQEFSDQEEDIDVLISAHNKTANRPLNSALSTVAPMSQTHSGKSCIQICTCTHCVSLCVMWQLCC